MADLEITPEDVKRLLTQSPEAVLLVDCRRDDEVAICAIVGALHVPLQEIAHRADDILDEAGERVVIVYCHHGVRSVGAVAMLKASGVANARSMAGGIDAWSTRIDPAVPTY